MRRACATSHNSKRLFSLLAACGLALSAWAQASDAPAPDDNPLAGPTVDATAKPTLVKRDFEGTLQRLDTRPEAAAIELLTLTPDQRAKVNQVLERRSADVAKLTTEHYELFLKLQAARQGGDRHQLFGLMREFREVAAPLLKPSFASQVHDALPEEQREEFSRLVDEYIDALASEPDPMVESRMGQEPRDGAPRAAGARAPSRRRIEMNLLIREMARGFGDMVEERREHTDELLKALNATPEQESKIRAIVRENGDAAALNPTPEQRAERTRKIMKELTPEQRRAWIDYHRGRRTEPAAK